MELIILRHGKTAGNRDNRYVGRTDQPLCDEYIDEIKAKDCDLTISMVYVSPLQRARQTAQILFPNAQQTVVEDFREMDFGDFEGRTSEEMVDDAAYIEWVDGLCEGLCPNGEDLSGFSNRVCRAFTKLTLNAAENGKEKLVIVAHGGTIMAIMSRFAEERKPYFEWFAENCHGWSSKVDMKDPNSDIVLSDCKLM